jgi:transglutaminase-like putative cysteine protease
MEPHVIPRKAILFVLLLLACQLRAQPASRHFTLHYEFTVRSVRPGERVRIWAPLAHSDEFQDVKLLSATGDLPLRTTRERKFGNTMLYAESPRASKTEYHFAIEYEVVRRERLVDVRQPQPRSVTLPARQAELYLEPDRLVPVSGLPAELAAKQVKGLSTPLERAHAIYNYVLHNMRYEKTGSGWGRGDVLYACDAKQGNCSDFHSLFISMARSQKIPARFEIGFPLPRDAHSGEIAGYHCWSDFYVRGYGWVPVDISEAWKHPDKRDYYFGAHDANRVQFTVGRDLVLSPAQQGPPLNYFIYPYVEVDGREHANITQQFSFADLSAIPVAKAGR